jgi:ribosomal protein S18 acetylase RimI-like enzyme
MPTSREICEDFMSRTYQERPKSWPNGLHVESFVPRLGESVYLVRTKSASTPVGFVGWQVRREGGKRVGYYTVGLMPEHRGRGYAKEAVQKLITIKSAGVDVVRALIQKDNAKSIALAEALGVEITKVASANPFAAAEATSRAAAKVQGAVDPVVNAAESVGKAAAPAIEAANRVNDVAGRVDGTLQSLTSTAAGLGAGLRLTAGAGLGALAGHTAADLALDDLPPSAKNYQRNRRLKILAALLGAGAGAYANHKLSK